MKDREKIFRAYDIRGIYPNQLNRRVIGGLADALVSFFPRSAKIIVGRDARKSSPVLLKELERELLKRGISVYHAGLITSPLLVFLVRSKKMDGGIIVTASHNPPEYNGLKIVDKNGVAISGTEVEKRLANVYGAPKQKTKRKCVDIRHNAISAYVSFLRARVDVKKHIRVVFDTSHGAVGPIIKKICSGQKYITPIFLHTSPNGEFPPQGPDPTHPKTQEFIKKEIIKQKADAGIIFDGDGDRIVLLDGRGNVVRPEYVWRLLLLITKVKKTVYAVPLEWMMKVLAQKLRDDAVLMHITQSRVGHSFMVQKMRAIDADVGVEQSGHYYFKDFFYAGSGLLAALYALNGLSVLPYTLREFSLLLPFSYRMKERRIKKKYDTRKIYAACKKMLGKNAILSSLDGVSGWMEGGWFNVRASNTELGLRINVEARTKKEAEGVYKKISRTIKNIIPEGE